MNETISITDRMALIMSNSDLAAADEKELEKYRAIVDLLCEKEDRVALAAKAYCLYGGNAAYDCDWTTSRDLLLGLMERSDVPDREKACYANTLGYIYYYGRCNNGTPDYASAARYFSLGLAMGYYESAYKMADLFTAGNGVDKNDLAAYNLVKWVYDQTIDDFLGGFEETKFADAALRLGVMYRDGKVGAGERSKEQADSDLRKAYELFLQADLALRMRADTDASFGDEKVCASVQEALRGMRKLLPDAEPCKFAEFSTPNAIIALFDGKTDVEVTIKRTKKGLTLSARRRWGNGVPFILPEYNYCKVIKKAKQKLRKVLVVWLEGRKKELKVGESYTFVANEAEIQMRYTKKRSYAVEFTYDGYRKARISARKNLFRVNWNGRTDVLI